MNEQKMMLLSGAAYPRTFHKKDKVCYVMTEYDPESVDAGQDYSYRS